MNKRWKQAAVIGVIAFGAAQLVRPGQANPPIEENHTIQAQPATPVALTPILERACGDCHSNRTVWPWYTQVAPLSWVMAYGVKEGRRVLNISEWSGYSPAVQRALLSASCRAVSEGRMPGSAWIRLHPEARLSTQDIQTICAAARGPEVPNGQ